jgi:hypothetical protein
MDPYGNHMICGQMTYPGIASPFHAFVTYMDRRAVPYWEYFFMDTLTGGSSLCNYIAYSSTALYAAIKSRN